MWCVNCEGPSPDLDSVSGSLSWAGAAAGAGLKAVVHRDNKPGHGDTQRRSAHQGIGPGCTQASSDVRWGFPRSGWESRGLSTVEGNILLCLLPNGWGALRMESSEFNLLKLDFKGLPVEATSNPSQR